VNCIDRLSDADALLDPLLDVMQYALSDFDVLADTEQVYISHKQYLVVLFVG
jgi:hypothetical protein